MSEMNTSSNVNKRFQQDSDQQRREGTKSRDPIYQITAERFVRQVQTPVRRDVSEQPKPVRLCEQAEGNALADRLGSVNDKQQQEHKDPSLRIVGHETIDLRVVGTPSGVRV